VDRPPTPHALRWPYAHPWAVAFWRALYFRPQVFLPEPARGADWNRGAYLVRGLGHCAACHAPRTGLGGTIASAELGGGLMAAQNWHAPALGGPAEGSELVELLRTGRSRSGSALGPMADVVLHSTQHLDPGDLRAMAGYLASLPAPAHAAHNDEATLRAAAPGVATHGAGLYEKHCAGCHGEDGDGQGLYSALAGNRTVNLASPTNLVKAIREGGFAPNTQANPRPFGMPPFAHVLSEAEIAAVASHVRTQWGNAAGPVSELQVLRAR
jgi:mono/diheme cytochrome c family protein